MSDAPRQPAVENGRLNYTSATALNRFIFGCETSYFFRYVEGRPDPAGKAAELGFEIHGRIENHLKLGVDILGRHERAALDAGLIPRPGGPGRYANRHPDKSIKAPLMLDILAEGKVDGMLDLGGVPLIGGLDLLDPRGEVPVLTDWKTKGDISEVAAVLYNGPLSQHNPEVNGRALAEALVNPGTEYGLQMIAYAEWFRRTHPERTHLLLRHVYIQTKKALVGETKTAPIPLAKVKDLWNGIAHAHLGPLKKVAAAKSAKDTRGNLDHCHKYPYKPCVYVNVCPHRQEISFGNLFNLGVEKVGLLDQFKKLTETPVADPIVAPPVPAPAADPGFTPGGAYTLGDGTTGTLVSVDGRIGRFQLEGGAFKDVLLAAATAVEAPKADPVTAPPADLLPVKEENAVEKKKRGRPAKAKPAAEYTEAELMKLREENEKLWPDTTKVDPSPAVAFPTWPAAKAAPPDAVRLYLGCAPIGVVTQTLHSYVDELERTILKTLDETLPDVRLSSHEMLSFGKWKGVLTQSALKALPPPGHYVVPGIPGEKLQVVVDALVGVCGPGNVVSR